MTGYELFPYIQLNRRHRYNIKRLEKKKTVKKFEKYVVHLEATRGINQRTPWISKPQKSFHGLKAKILSARID